MAVNTSLTARDDETYEMLLTSADGTMRLWHDKGETPGYKIVYQTKTVWYRAPTPYQWRKDKADALAMAEAMATDVGLTLAPPARATGRVVIQGATTPRRVENREDLAMLGRLFGEHVSPAYGEEMTPKARPDRGRVAPATAPTPTPATGEK